MQGERFVDLTAGSGADCFAFAMIIKHGLLVDHHQDTIDILRHNAACLKAQKMIKASLEMIHGRGEDLAQSMDNVDLVYIDPQRRNHSRRGIFDLSQCSPDVLNLLPRLISKAKRIMLKTSPMLDIKAAIQSLGCVSAVYVVQWRGECKEVLYLMNAQERYDFEDVPITALEINDEGAPKNSFTYTQAQEQACKPHYALPQGYIYEPGPAFQKSGGFSCMAEQYGLSKLHPQTHLYTSDDLVGTFPGACYAVEDSVPVQAKALRIKKAELSLRNFPGEVLALRKKLNLGDGGPYRVFACKLLNEDNRLIVSKKIN
jgi:hypothetical protein